MPSDMECPKIDDQLAKVGYVFNKELLWLANRLPEVKGRVRIKLSGLCLEFCFLPGYSYPPTDCGIWPSEILPPHQCFSID